MGANDIVRGAEMLPLYARVLLPAGGGLVGGLDRPLLFRRASALGDLPHDRGRLARPPHRAPAAVARARGVLDRRHRVRRLGGPRGPDHPDRRRLRVGARPGVEAVARARADPDGLRHGRRRRGRVQHADRGDALRSRGRRRLVLDDALRPRRRRRPSSRRWSCGSCSATSPSTRSRRFRVESLVEFVPVHGDRCCSAGRLRRCFVRVLALGKRLFAASKLPRLGGDGAGRSDRRRDRASVCRRSSATASRATNRILHGNPALVFLLVLFVAKMVATAATIGSGGVGRRLHAVPAGRRDAGRSRRRRSCTRRCRMLAAPVGGYALLGMGGLLAGVTRAPLLAVIMIFELTQNTAVLVPMMVVSVLAVARGQGAAEGLDLRGEPPLGRHRLGDDARGDRAREPQGLRRHAPRRRSSSRGRRPCRRSSRRFSRPAASSSTSATRRGGSWVSWTSTTSRSRSRSGSSRTLVIAADLVDRDPFRHARRAADVRQREALVPGPRAAAGRRVGRMTGSFLASSRGATCSAPSTARSCSGTAS